MTQPNATAATEDFEFAALSEAVNYRKAIVREFGPYLTGRILEVGAGVGQTSEALLALGATSELVAVEPEEKFQRGFRERLPTTRLIGGTTADIPTDESFDAAVLVNVLEHIDDDRDELRRLHSILAPRMGYVCLLVPARQEIYSELDRHFGHFRRYSRGELRGKLRETGFEIEKISYFNFVGYFAWATRFKIMRSMSFDIDQVRVFDRRIFPTVHWFESHVCRPPIGQSVIAIARAG